MKVTPVSDLVWRGQEVAYFTEHFVFVLSFTVSDVLYSQETYTFLSVRLKKICDVLLAESPREILHFGKKKLVIIPSRITAARLSWSLNNHGPWRGFIDGLVCISFSVLVVSALRYGAQGFNVQEWGYPLRSHVDSGTEVWGRKWWQLLGALRAVL